MVWCMQRFAPSFTHLFHAAMLAWVVLIVGVASTPAGAQPPSPAPPQAAADKPTVSINDPAAFQGYTLISPMNSTKTHLLDMQGRVVHTWQSDTPPALCAYLLENGNLLRPASIGNNVMAFGGGPGAGGKIQEYTWDGELVWDFTLINDKQIPHHDITRLPNGNVLMIVSDKKTAAEAIAAGRHPDTVQDSYLLVDSILEIKPTGKTTGDIVWQWHLWDHLIQDIDRSKANYGRVNAHPELVDLNFGQDIVGRIAADPAGAQKLRSIGYVGATTTRRGPQRSNPDWTHFNSVAYHPQLDQIVVSVHSLSEIWIIDHSTSTTEAAGHGGGRSGKGGDLLYRWGNPRAYRSGTNADQRLFSQHDAHWIAAGHPGEGHLLVFNNGGQRPDGSYSSVDEIVTPVDSAGHYVREPGMAFAPDRAVWSYSAPNKPEFFSMLVSGAQRLPNGNTLICSGLEGTLFEVAPDNRIVWKHSSPNSGMRPPFGGPGGPGGPSGPGGPGPGFGPPPLGQVLPFFLQGMLRMSDDQKRELNEYQKELGSQIDKLLTDAQKQKLREPPRFAFGPGAPPDAADFQVPRLGDILPSFLQKMLELTPEQKAQLDGLQQGFDQKLETLLADDQRQQFQDMRDGVARGGPFGFGPPGSGPPGPPGFGPPGPPGSGQPGGPGFGPPGGPPGIFRCSRYAADYPGLVGKSLTPEEIP